MVTEPCYECEHMKPTPYVAPVPASTCKHTHKSLIPYTSGSSTYYISSCTPITNHITITETEAGKHGTCEAATTTVYRNGSGSAVAPVQISTVVLTQYEGGPTVTKTNYRNVTAAPVTAVMTVTSWRKGSAPATVYVKLWEKSPFLLLFPRT